MTKVRVLLADDSVFTRLGVVAFLQMHEDMEVVGEAADGLAALKLYEAHRPDVLVADLRMPVFDGVHLTARVRALDPRARILVLSHYDGERDVARAIEAGAAGYLHKDAHGPELVAAIRMVSRGERYVPESISARLAAHAAAPPLSPREQQILREIARGASNRQIAEGLRIAEKTVAIHVGNLLKKLGAKSRTEAVTIGVARGLITLA